MRNRDVTVASTDPPRDASLAAPRRRLGVAFGITVSVLVAQLAGAWVTGSHALLVDAGHVLVDAGGLLLALTAAGLVLRPATPQHTWGFRRAEILAAGAQATLLLAVAAYAVGEGVRRLAAPPEVPGTELLIFGVVGLVGNIASALILGRHRDLTLNLRAAFLEVVMDALGSVAVVVSAVLIATVGWTRADPLAGILIAALIIPRAVVILRDAGSVLLESTPPGLDLDDVRRHILALPHVMGVHDLHASLIATGLPVLSAHVVLDDACFTDGHAPQVLDQLQDCVAEHFAVSVVHSTFQIEPAGHAAHERQAHT